MTKARRNVPNSKHQHTQENNKKLPLFLLLGGAVILLIAALFAFQKKPAAYTPEVSGGPSLKVDKELLDLGDQKLGSTTQASFTLTNIGNQPLQFTEVPYIEVKEGC
jgi:hypothetical protein